MLKKYRSKSCISLSVLMETGKSVHVSFDSLTGGGSVFYTEDEELQAAMAKHPKFGRLFTEEELPAAAEPAKEKKPTKAKKVELPDEDENDGKHEDNAPEDSGEDTGSEDAGEDTCEAEDTEATDDTEDDTEDENDGKHIHVTDLEDAKNYLADTYGVSRTKVRSKKQILEVAEAHGIVFVGI